MTDTIHTMTTSSMVTDSMETMNVTGKTPPMATAEVVVLGFLAALTSVLTIAGNLIVLFSFVVERSIRQPTNYFIASLAVSDLLIGAISMPLYTVYLLAGKHWPLGELLCDLWLSVDYTLCLSSIYTVCCITIDRFCSVKIPAKYRHWRTERKVLAIIGVVWVLPIAVFFTTIIGWQYFVGRRTVPEGKCYVQYMESQVFNAVLQMGYFWATLVVMCVLYAGIYTVALELQQKSEKKHRKAAALGPNGSGVRQSTPDTVTRDVQPSNGDTTCVVLFTRTGEVDVGTEESRDDPATSRRMSENEREGDRSSTGFSSDTDPSSSANPPNLQSKTTLGVVKYNASRAASTQDLMTRSRVSHKTEDVTVARAISAQNIATVCSRLDQRVDVIAMTSAVTRCEDGAACSAFGLLWDTATEDIRDLNDKRGQVMEDIRTSNVQTNPGKALSYTIESQCSSETQMDRSRLEDDGCRRASFDLSRSPSPVWVYRPSVEREFGREGIVGDDRNGVPCDEKACGENDASPGFNPQVSCDLDVEWRETGLVETGLDRPDQGVYHHHRQHHIQQQHQGVDKERHRHTDRKPFHGRLLGTVARCYHRCRDCLRRTHGARRPHCRKSRREDRARKAIRTITIILGAFVVCWTPWHVLSMTMGFCPNCVWDVLYDVSYWLCYLNSPINPFCYAFANQQFKRTFVRIVRLDWHKA